VFAGACGVPLIKPPLLIGLKPGGSNPDDWLQEYGGVPPVALNVCE